MNLLVDLYIGQIRDCNGPAMSGQLIYKKMEPQVLKILQKHLDSWYTKQYLPTKINCSVPKDIQSFIDYWYENQKTIENIKKMPGPFQGNLAYVIKLCQYYSNLV